MIENPRMLELTNTLAHWKAVPQKPINFNDLKSPNFMAKLLSEGPKVNYETFHAMFPVIQELCELYLTANPTDQAAVREAVANSHDALHALRQWQPVKGTYTTYEEFRQVYNVFKDEDFSGWLRLLLAALAIQYHQIDYRDDILALQNLAGQAQKRGVDFAPFQAEFQRLSGQG